MSLGSRPGNLELSGGAMNARRLLTAFSILHALCALGWILHASPATAATITWKTGVSGSWTVASNWLPAQVPGVNDVAVITAAPVVEGGYDVSINSNVSVSAISIGSSARLKVNNVTLTTTSGIAVGASATLEVNSGTLSGGGVSLNGTLSSTGTSNVNVALTTATSSTITAGVGLLTVDNGFINRGQLSFSGFSSSTLSVTNGTLANATTGTIVSTTDGRLLGNLNNQGSISVSGTLSGLLVQKTGTAHVSSGSITVSGNNCQITFSLFSSTLNTSGNISVGAGCGLDVIQGDYTQTAGSISGSGTFGVISTTSAHFASNPTVANLYLSGGGMVFPSALANGAAQAISFGPDADLTVPQFTNQYGYTLDFSEPNTAIHAPIFTNLGQLAVRQHLLLDASLNIGPASLLVMDIGAGLAWLEVSGALQLGGNLRVLDFFNNPVPGDTHDLITQADRFGDFGQLELVWLGSDPDLYVVTDPATTSSNTHPYRVRIVRQKWTSLSPSGVAPAPRRGQSTIYAPSSGSMIVFGGENGAGQMLNDVWVLNHADGLSGSPAWVQLNPTGTPPAPRKGHSAVYDVGNNRMTVFGGESDGSVFLADIWILTNADGTTGTPAWEQFASIPGVFPRSGHGAGYSPISNRMVMSQGGGSAADCGPYYGEMWTLDHANGMGTSAGWTSWSIPGTPPSDRRDASWAYDPVHNRLLVYGGRALCGAVQTDAFVLLNADGTPNNYTGWTPLGNAASPSLPGQAGAQAAYDPYYDRLITFGGIKADGTTFSSQVFYLGNTLGDAAGWTQLPLPSTRPSARAFHSMVYSASAKRWIVFGGDANGTLMNDVWTLELDGDGALVTGIGSDPVSLQKKQLAFSTSPYPNPSSRGMQFSVKAREDTRAQIVIYDTLGRRVALLYNGPMTMGEHRFTWSGDVASGIYFVAARSGESQEVRRVVVAH